MDLQVTRDSGVPVGTQLAVRLRSAIERGELAPGDRLPSLRDAATAATVNVNTVRAVYAKLEAAGLVDTEQGRGTFVTAPSPASGSGSALRRLLRDEIAQLEAELVSLPLLPRDTEVVSKRAARPRLLSVEELTAIRDVLAERVRELHVARAEIVERLGSNAVSDAAPTPPARVPSRRSSSSLAGARVRWTGA